MEYTNNTNVIMMVSDRNLKDQEIKFCAKKSLEIDNGDVIVSGPVEERVYYMINSIIENRPAAVSGYNYITAKSVRSTKTY